MSAPTVQLVGRDNGAGLSRDMRLVADALAALGVGCTVDALPHQGAFARWRTRRRYARSAPAYALQIQFERIRPEFFGAARRHVLIPNPEWFAPAQHRLLGDLDAVWTKTAHAARLFGALGACIQPLGFISPDRLDLTVPRQATFFHGPGRSGMKGTVELLALWGAHPQWPELTVVWRGRNVAVDALPANVRLIREHLDDAHYRALQNRHRFHLCPSRTEGFGHSLVEALSCGAVVVTLDAEPMNELIDADAGLRVAAQPCGRKDLATLYQAAPGAMAQAIDTCIAMPAQQAQAFGAAARRAYEAQRTQFHQHLRAALEASGIASR